LKKREGLLSPKGGTVKIKGTSQKTGIHNVLCKLTSISPQYRLLKKNNFAFRAAMTIIMLNFFDKQLK